MQGDLFLGHTFETILDYDGEVIYYPSVMADQNLESLMDEIKWEEHVVTLYGKTHKAPRLLAFYGDLPCLTYSYSGTVMRPHPWTEKLRAIKKQVENLVGVCFNSALVNLYRDGKDSVGGHSDDEKEMDPLSPIASLSIGARRRFVLVHKKDKGQEKVLVDLGDGDLLLMRPGLQKYWKHQLNKTTKKVGPRINITFRNIIRS